MRWSAWTVLALVSGLAAVALIPQALAAVVPTADADDLLAALDVPAARGATATWQTPPPPDAAGVANAPAAGFPRSGTTFAVLTTGRADEATAPNDGTARFTDHGVGPVRGTSDFDVSVLALDFTGCDGGTMTLQYRFLSEEFPEYSDSPYQDALLFELAATTWTTRASGTTHDAHDSVSLNDVEMRPEFAAGTTYDGATDVRILRASVDAGRHTLYVSLLDFGDGAFDSAAFLDTFDVACCNEQPPGQPLLSSETHAGGVDLDWAYPNECSHLTEVERRVVGLPWPPLPLATVAAGVNEWTDTSAEPCLTYEYRVRGVRGLTSGARSAPRLAGWMETHGVADLAITPDDEELVLTWQVPASCVTELHIAREPAMAPLALGPTVTTWRDEDILRTTECVRYRVWTHNHAASMGQDELASAVMTESHAPPPEPLPLTVSGDVFSAYLAWGDAPCNPRFDVLRSQGASPTLLGSVNHPATEWTDLTVQACHDYAYQVRAQGTPAGTWLSPWVAFEMPDLPPNPPTDLVLNAPLADWNGSFPAPCRPETYTVQASLNGGPPALLATVDYPASRAIIPQVTAWCGDEVATWVTAHAAGGESEVAPSAVVTRQVLPAGPAGPITGLQAQATEPVTARLSWDHDNQGGCRSVYSVFRKASFGWPDQPMPGSPQRHATRLVHVPPCEPSHFRVVADNGVARGLAADLEVQGELAPPGAAPALVARADRPNVTVSWLPPEGPCPVDSYTVVEWVGGAWVTVALVDGDVRSVTVSSDGRDCGAAYAVIASNAAGPGPRSAGAYADLRWAGWNGTGNDDHEAWRHCRIAQAPAPTLDWDADGVADVNDNCPVRPNEDQVDADADGTGDACEIPASEPAAQPGPEQDPGGTPELDLAGIPRADVEAGLLPETSAEAPGPGAGARDVLDAPRDENAAPKGRPQWPWALLVGAMVAAGGWWLVRRARA